MNFAEKYFSYNSNGCIRAEFITKEDGVLPLRYFAKLLNANLMMAFEWDKRYFRGMLLNAAHINDEGIKCDEDGNPLEDENFNVLPGRVIERWPEGFWVSTDGAHVLTDEERGDLSPEDLADYRYLRCMRLEPVSDDYDGGTIYITEEAVSVLAEVLMNDVVGGDPVARRYQHECRHDKRFESKFGYTLKEGLKRLQEKLEAERVIHHMAASIAEELFGRLFSSDESDKSEEAEGQDESKESGESGYSDESSGSEQSNDETE